MVLANSHLLLQTRSGTRTSSPEERPSSLNFFPWTTGEPYRLVTAVNCAESFFKGEREKGLFLVSSRILTLSNCPRIGPDTGGKMHCLSMVVRLVPAATEGDSSRASLPPTPMSSSAAAESSASAFEVTHAEGSNGQASTAGQGHGQSKTSTQGLGLSPGQDDSLQVPTTSKTISLVT